jgi:hypothetical protein
MLSRTGVLGKKRMTSLGTRKGRMRSEGRRRMMMLSIWALPLHPLSNLNLKQQQHMLLS